MAAHRAPALQASAMVADEESSGPKTNIERSVLRSGRPETNVERPILRSERPETNVERPVLRSGRSNINVERPVQRSWCHKMNAERSILRSWLQQMIVVPQDERRTPHSTFVVPGVLVIRRSSGRHRHCRCCHRYSSLVFRLQGLGHLLPSPLGGALPPDFVWITGFLSFVIR